jgi:hypothetical protein
MQYFASEEDSVVQWECMLPAVKLIAHKPEEAKVLEGKSILVQNVLKERRSKPAIGKNSY